MLEAVLALLVDLDGDGKLDLAGTGAQGSTLALADSEWPPGTRREEGAESVQRFPLQRAPR